MRDVAARRAQSRDGERIADLASSAARVILQIPWRDVELEPDRSGGAPTEFFVACADDTLVCACGVVIGLPDVAHIRFFALHDAWSVSRALDAVMPLLLDDLVGHGVAMLAFIGVEKWFAIGLESLGFEHVNSVLALQKTDFSVPDGGSADVVVRRVRTTDYARIEDIDRLAFSPLWRNTVAMLDAYAHTHPYFVVAELDDVVVGYAFAYLQGRHGHLTRLAVHPDYHGKRIGIRLLREVVDFMRRRRVFGITLNTQQDNLRSRSLYAWFGFTPLGRDADVLVRVLST